MGCVKAPTSSWREPGNLQMGPTAMQGCVSAIARHYSPEQSFTARRMH